MKLPRKVRVGNKHYSVEIVEAMAQRGRMGDVNHLHKRITISQRSNVTGKKFKVTDVEDTFWHELTHAILADMGMHDLNNNEKFVTGFANRLTKAIQTARF
jgi:hypothetical protein